jgi:hypothetical protein
LRPPRRPFWEAKAAGVEAPQRQIIHRLGRRFEAAQKLDNLICHRPALELHLIAPEVPMHGAGSDVGERRLVQAHQLGKGVADGQRGAGKTPLILMGALRGVVDEAQSIVGGLSGGNVNRLENEVVEAAGDAPRVLSVDGIDVVVVAVQKGLLQLDRRQARRKVKRDMKMGAPTFRPLNRGDPERGQAVLGKMTSDELRGAGAERGDGFRRAGLEASAGMTRDKGNEGVKGKASKKSGSASAVRQHRVMNV